MKKIELLAPAGNLEIGMAAIEHGADAVYVGAPEFSARAVAGNSVADIEKLARFAHGFHARVYVALNTLLNDDELGKAVSLISELYNAGVDALIIQDMGLLECDLPPISLHASTQMDNRTPEKVKFLENIGFEQVVLARELSLAQIAEICDVTQVNIECFVHGASCVSYSGQCYISEKMAGRSANRGRCAQFCRHKFKLSDFSGEVLRDEAYLLSLMDMDLSGQLGSLISAGVTSFKIEGRLKDSNYVKNVTALYRNKLDEIMSADSELTHVSSGHCTYSFQPDAERTFHRGKTDYFLMDEWSRPGSLITPKSIGQKIGRVHNVQGDRFSVQTSQKLVNGDGLYFIDQNKKLFGFRANRVEGNVVYPRERVYLQNGDVLYRNRDVSFVKQLDKSTHCRRITLTVSIVEVEKGVEIVLRDEDEICSSIHIQVEWETARQSGRILELMQRQFMKTGGTVYTIETINVRVDPSRHIPVAEINSMRRQALDNHNQMRLDQYVRPEKELKVNNVPWLRDHVSWRDNVTNSQAEAFYRRHGVISFPTQGDNRLDAMQEGLMATKYCIRRQLGICPKDDESHDIVAAPLLLTDNSGEYEVYFNCGKCEMVIKGRGNEKDKG